MIKKIFITLGVIFTVIIILLGSAFIFLNTYGKKYDKSSQEYLDDEVPKILTFDRNYFNTVSSPEFKQTMSAEKTTEWLNFVSNNLGKFKKYNGCQGEAFLGTYGLFPLKTKITANYICNADFENGQSVIKMTLIQHDGKWQVLGMYFSADSVLK